MRRLIFLPLMTLFLAACQKNATILESAAQPVYRELGGTTLVLNQDLDVAAAQARVFIQDGVVREGFNSYRAHCAFEIDDVQHDGAVIRADRFTVSRVQSARVQVVQHEPLHVAAMWRVSGMGRGGSASYYDGYHFWLTSADQPQVRRMSCFGVYAQPSDLYPPTMEEIRSTLGSIATLE